LVEGKEIEVRIWGEWGGGVACVGVILEHPVEELDVITSSSKGGL